MHVFVSKFLMGACLLSFLKSTHVCLLYRCLFAFTNQYVRGGRHAPSAAEFESLPQV